MDKIKVIIAFGTRPEAIKMLPIVKKMDESEAFHPITVVTAQHREMLDQVLDYFKVKPDYDLNIMRKQQTLTQITSRILEEMEEVLISERPDVILVHGDTTTTAAVSLAAFYQQITIGHVEAGLRTWNKYSPFPEEMNRQLTDVLSDLYFVPTRSGKKNLLLENHKENKIFITGNTVIDALQYTLKEDYHHPILDEVNPKHKKMILLTMHRRENQGQPMLEVFEAVRNIAIEYKDEVEIIFPVHLNPLVQRAAMEKFAQVTNVHLITPLEVADFHNIASKSYLILTDSGGIQEEAPSLGVPVLVLRNETERPEGVTAGTLKLVGTKKEVIEKAMKKLLDNEEAYKAMSQASNPYGDGKSSERIMKILIQQFADGRLRATDNLFRTTE